MLDETILWYRDPDKYIKELVETGELRLCWERATLVKREIDPFQFCALYFGAENWKALIIGDGCAPVIDASHNLKKPVAVYPVWKYGDSLDELMELCENPVGEDVKLYSDRTVPADERPVKNQDHVIVITGLPLSSSGPGRRILRNLKEIHEDYPKSTFYIHGMYSYRVLFGMGFGAGDITPKTASKGGVPTVVIPPGSEVTIKQLVANPMWCRTLGFKPVDLEIPRNRLLFNIKSAAWAAKYWTKEIAIKLSGEADTKTPEAAYYPPTVGRHTITARKGAPGDKVICDECSLAVDCKYYRAGFACGVPKTEISKLAAFFGTRDSNDIIDGLSTLLKRNAERLDDALDMEKAIGDMDANVSRQMNQVFDQGLKLAKLIDPTLRGGPNVQVNVGSGGTASVNVGDTRQIVAAAMRELEASGIKREDITPAMIEGILTRGASGGTERAAIEGHVVRSAHPDLPPVPQPVPRTESR